MLVIPFQGLRRLSRLWIHPGPLVDDNNPGKPQLPFTRGMRDWGVLLARIEEHPTHGVIFLPAWNLLIAAERSKGCWVNGETVRFSAPVAFDEIVLGTELNPRLTDEHRRRIIDPLSSKTLTTRCLACGAAGFAELILGRTSLYVNCKGVGSGTLRLGL